MAFDGYVVYDTDNLISGIRMTQAAADTFAATDADYTAHQAVTSLPDDVRLGWYFNDTDNTVSGERDLTSDELILIRRKQLKDNIRTLEQIPGLASWATVNHDYVVEHHTLDRAKYYSRWVEGQARASSLDANLSDDHKFGQLLAESQIPGDWWYFLYDLSQWLGFYPDDRTDTAWITLYLTQAGHTPPYSDSNLNNNTYDSRQGSVTGDGGAVGRRDTVSDVFQWVQYLRESP